MIRRPPRSTPLYSSAASDVYKRQSLYVCNEKLASEFKAEYALDDRPVVLSVGLVFMRKGIVDFVTIAKRLPHFQFVWAGRIVIWPFFPRAARKVIATAPKNVLFTGRV